MGKVFFSCGHEDKIRPVSGWPLVTYGYDTFSDGSYDKVINHRTVCHSCYLHAVQDYPEFIIFDDWEEDEWFGKT